MDARIDFLRTARLWKIFRAVILVPHEREKLTVDEEEEEEEEEEENDDDDELETDTGG